MLAFRRSNCGLLNTLKNSPRNCSPSRSDSLPRDPWEQQATRGGGSAPIPYLCSSECREMFRQRANILKLGRALRFECFQRSIDMPSRNTNANIRVLSMRRAVSAATIRRPTLAQMGFAIGRVESVPKLSKIQPASRRHQPRPILGNVPPLLRSKIGALTEVQFVRGNLHLITALAEDGAQGDR